MELYSKHMNEAKLISQFMIFLERNVEIELLSALNDIFFPFIKRQHSQYFVFISISSRFSYFDISVRVLYKTNYLISERNVIIRL